MSRLEDLKGIIDTNLEKLDISDETKERIKRETAAANRKFSFKRLRLAGIPAVAVIVIVIMLFSNIFGTNPRLTVKALDLMEAITAAKIEPVKLSSDFIKAQANFSVDLFRQTVTGGEKNVLISPISAYIALAMTANGAADNTLKEFEAVLGKHGMNMDTINKYCYSHAASLKDAQSGKFSIANSVWYTQDNAFNVNRGFLQTNSDYYGAAAYRADFHTQQTIRDMNSWVKFKTGKLIDKIIDNINPNAVMYLISALYFEAEWQNQYEKEQIRSEKFHLADGTAITTEFMYSPEYGYLEDDRVKGFVKPYQGNKFSFVALLPDEGISVGSYAASLTGEKLLSILENKADESVFTVLPKFKSEYGKSLVDPLKAMGLKDCFDMARANLSRMDSEKKSNLYISDVKHKTFIQVDGLGTKAGAVTVVEASTKSALIREKSVVLDRPFVYAIIDNTTNLPIFIGTMNDPR